MAEQARRFTNEVGNEIAVTVRTVPAVEIRMVGPTSTMANLITLAEAQHLLDCLQIVVGGDSDGQ